VTINLNGHTLDRKLTKRGEGGGQVITVREGATLNLSNGTLKGGWGGAGGALVNEGGMVTLTDVIITNNVADDRGGGICNREGGTLVMTGGVITDNSSNDHSGAKGGGGFFNEENATATLTGVTLTGNVAKVYGGGGICNFGTLTIDGCTITGNTAGTYGGGIWQEGTLNMQGANTISDNKCETINNNLYLKSGKVINVTGSLEGSSIGVNLESITGTFTSGYNTHNNGVDPSTIFKIDNPFGVSKISLNDTGEAQVVSTLPEGSVYYVENVWDEENKKTMPMGMTVASGQYTLVTDQMSGTWDEGFYVVKGNALGIGNIKIKGHVQLILCDGALMNLSNSRFDLSGGNTLSIYGQANGTGKLTIEVRTENNPGIGSYGGSCGTLNIHGGIISSKGGNGCAGIGSGHDSENFGTINIYGGNITAKGGDSPGGAGIGGGRYNSWGTLNIYGGSINATGGHEAAGIGCGQDFTDNPRTKAKVTIHGGTVIAHGDSYAAGIGGGDGIYGADITINGGHVEAYGGVDGAGIGGGEDASSGPVTINGGYVYAVADGNAAGIGGGEDGGFQDIIITGGHVQAKGSGIGSGISSGGAGGDDNTIIEISGDAIVEAWAGEDAAEEEGRAFGTDSDYQPYDRDDYDDDFPGLPHRARRRLWGGGSKGTIMFRDHAICVFAGKNKNSATIINEDHRLLACWFNAYARLEPCQHEGHTYTYSGTTAKDTHTMKCKYCRYAPTELHTFEDKVCTVCGVEQTFSGGTSIETMSEERSTKSDVWYDLQGRKLSDKPTTSGVYINGGKKVVMK
jgi:hypothetical protein